MKTTIKFAAASLVAAAFAHAPAAQDVTGAGASFPAPLYAKWAADYNKATGVKVNYQSVGSGAGIKQIDAKTVDFGASDAPLKDDELARRARSSSPPSSAA
jgi:phosphate transport system substrate-binding protein